MRYFYLPLICIFLIFFSLPASGDHTNFPKRNFDVLHYDLSVKIGFEHSGYEIGENKLSGIAKISLKNTADTAITEIPVVLHRLMKATSVSDGQGDALRFSQNIQSLEGRDTYQINYIRIGLKNPLASGAQMQIQVSYEGHLTGYTETGMLYVRETLDPAFTILRTETFAYPHILFPVDDQTRDCWNDAFEQTIEVNVPKGYVAINAGGSSTVTALADSVTYHFRSASPRNSITIPIARYEQLNSQNNHIYYFTEDRHGAETVGQFMDKACALFTSWFGPLKHPQGISVVEIPAGFGSQADYPLIIQTADAFQKISELGQLYHELSHLWNPEELETVPPRWNEGLAMFLQGLVTEEFGEQGASRGLTERLFTSFQKRLGDDKEAQRTAMKDYGVKDLTGLSYSGGEVFFAIVYELLGSEKFLNMYHTFYDQYGESGATTDDLLRHLAGYRDPRIDALIQDWFQTANYAPLVLSAADYQKLLEHYQGK